MAAGPMEQQWLEVLAAVWLPEAAAPSMGSSGLVSPVNQAKVLLEASLPVAWRTQFSVSFTEGEDA